MKSEIGEIQSGGWICANCGVPLELLPADATYMGSSFQVDLPRCPACGLTFIPQELAEGKMLEVEKLLEDK